jgi:hypothetical protein
LDENAKYEAIIYKDAANADWQTNPEAYKIEKRIVTKNDIIELGLAKGGGCAISFVKL